MHKSSQRLLGDALILCTNMLDHQRQDDWKDDEVTFAASRWVIQRTAYHSDRGTYVEGSTGSARGDYISYRETWL